MTRHALLIGSKTEGLLATASDIDAMSGALSEHGFTLDVRMRGDATRANILQGYESLISKVKENDVAVVYYTGHGARARNADFDGSGDHAYFQFIVPTDIYDSDEGDFRGISNHELSHYLDRLTARTRNVTVILDCCHAAQMSRSFDQLQPKSLPNLWYTGVASHVQELRASGIDVSIDAPGNANAVRVSACGENQSAFEYTASAGHRISILTESCCLALRDALHIDSLDWRTLSTRIRQRCNEVFPGQRPVIEGPASRVLFSLSKIDRDEVLSVGRLDGQPVLEAGRMFGISIGDEFSIALPGATGNSLDKRIGLATVMMVGAKYSKISIEYENEYTDVAVGALAFPLTRMGVKLTVQVLGEKSSHTALSKAIDDDPFLTISVDDGSIASAFVRATQTEIGLYDHLGDLLFEPKSNTDRGVTETIASLRVLQRSKAMRELESPIGRLAFNAKLDFTWGRVERGGAICNEPMHSALLFVGERVYFQVRNLDDRPIWVSVFDVGLTGKRTLLNSHAPDGIPLDAARTGQDTYVFGMQKGKLVGVELTWPEQLPKNSSRVESFVIVVMQAPHDLRILQGAGMKSNVETKLRSHLTQVDTEDPLKMDAEMSMSYDIHHATFYVDPFPAPIPHRVPFLIDESLDRSVLIEKLRASVTKPTPLTVTLDHFRSLSSNTSRLDAVVITPSGNSRDPGNWITTCQLSHKDNNTGLAQNPAVLYKGEATNLLVICLWASESASSSESLTAIVKPALQMLKTNMLRYTDDRESPILTLQFIHTLIECVHRQVQQVLNATPVYITTLTVADNYEVGHRPRSRLLRSGGYEFRYLVSNLS